MDYSIQEIDINDEGVIHQVNMMVGKTFGGDSLPPGRIEQSMGTDSRNDNLYLSAFKDGEVIGFLAFMAHDFILNGSLISCYQCGWAATKEGHRGKKIFQNLVNAGKEVLLSKGAALVFAFPTPGSDSHYIFTKKLDFKEILSLKWQSPNLPFIRDSFFGGGNAELAELKKNSILQNDEQLIELKKKKYDVLLKVEHNKGFVWGVKRQRKLAGLNLSYFDIGGVHPGDGGEIEILFKKLGEFAENPAYFQLVTFTDNSYNKFFNRISPAQSDSLVVFDLNLDTSSQICFNLFAGAKDVF